MPHQNSRLDTLAFQINTKILLTKIIDKQALTFDIAEFNQHIIEQEALIKEVHQFYKSEELCLRSLIDASTQPKSSRDEIEKLVENVRNAQLKSQQAESQINDLRLEIFNQAFDISPLPSESRSERQEFILDRLRKRYLAACEEVKQLELLGRAGKMKMIRDVAIQGKSLLAEFGRGDYGCPILFEGNVEKGEQDRKKIGRAMKSKVGSRGFPGFRAEQLRYYRMRRERQKLVELRVPSHQFHRQSPGGEWEIQLSDDEDESEDEDEEAGSVTNPRESSVEEDLEKILGDRSTNQKLPRLPTSPHTPQPTKLGGLVAALELEEVLKLLGRLEIEEREFGVGEGMFEKNPFTGRGLEEEHGERIMSIQAELAKTRSLCEQNFKGRERQEMEVEGEENLVHKIAGGGGRFVLG